jgi:hypothetical protein
LKLRVEIDDLVVVEVEVQHGQLIGRNQPSVDSDDVHNANQVLGIDVVSEQALVHPSGEQEVVARAVRVPSRRSDHPVRLDAVHHETDRGVIRVVEEVLHGSQSLRARAHDLGHALGEGLVEDDGNGLSLGDVHYTPIFKGS